MVPFHSVLPEIAQREVRCVHVLETPGGRPGSGLPLGEYAYLESYCEDLDCDCRRVFLQVVAKDQPGKIFASISYGWDEEAFYRKKMTWAPDAAKETIRGELDPLNEQSEFAQHFLDLFRNVVLDDSYRLRLARHSKIFREEIARREATGISNIGETATETPDELLSSLGSPMRPFDEICGGAAQAEVRVCEAPGLASLGLPTKYFLRELYCTDPDCDCRRVIVQFIPDQASFEIAASISCGWDCTSMPKGKPNSISPTSTWGI